MFLNPFTGLPEIPALSQIGNGSIVPTETGIIILTSPTPQAVVDYLGISAGGVVSVDCTSASSSLSVSGGPITGSGTFTFTLDATLQALGALNPTTDTIIYATGTNTFSTTALTAAARGLLDDASTSAMRTTLGLVIGSNVQAFSSVLSDFVSFATWGGSGNDLTLAGGLTTVEGITSQTSMLVSKNAVPSGTTLFELQNNSTSPLEILDTGVTTAIITNGTIGILFDWQLAGTGSLMNLDQDGALSIIGLMTAAAYAGDGSGISALDANNITSGTVANARLDADLAALGNNSSSGLWARTGAGTGSARTITGTANKIDVSDGNGVSGNPTITISASYVGQASITTLGTIGTGVWQGTTIAVANGGTGTTTSTGTGSTVLSASPSLTGTVGIGSASIRAGTGSPESVVTATVGSLFLRTDGGANTTLYVKESGSGNTGWVAK